VHLFIANFDCNVFIFLYTDIYIVRSSLIFRD